MQHDLEKIISSTKQVIPLPKDIETEVLQSIMVVLVTVNENEILATRSYLKSLDDHENVYTFNIDQGQHQAKGLICYIGKYGTCPAAIINIPHGFEVCESSSTVQMMAGECFPNLAAMISVGVVCGIQRKVKMFDVLVSSKIVDYDKVKVEHEEFLQKQEIIVLPQLTKWFTQSVVWPNDTIKKRLNNNSIAVPNVKSGIILSGFHLLDDSTMKATLIESVPEAIGIEMEVAHLFSAATANVIIIKAVCDFGDGKDSKLYQPTAALLAADLVHKWLSDPKAYEMFKGLYNLFV